MYLFLWSQNLVYRQIPLIPFLMKLPSSGTICSCGGQCCGSPRIVSPQIKVETAAAGLPAVTDRQNHPRPCLELLPLCFRYRRFFKSREQKHVRREFMEGSVYQGSSHIFSLNFAVGCRKHGCSVFLRSVSIRRTHKFPRFQVKSTDRSLREQLHRITFLAVPAASYTR